MPETETSLPDRREGREMLVKIYPKGEEKRTDTKYKRLLRGQERSLKTANKQFGSTQL